MFSKDLLPIVVKSQERLDEVCESIHAKPKCYYFKIVLTKACNNLGDSADQDQTARSVQSDLDLHCPQKQLNLVQAL